MSSTAETADRSTQRTEGQRSGVCGGGMGLLSDGPCCGEWLGDLGADVIKIEEPTNGDPMRQWGQAQVEGDSFWWSILGRNKRSVTLNLRDAEGQDVARKLIDSADIVLENFRPGSMEKWGLDYDTLSKDKPELIMVRVSGFGQSGPYSSRAGYGSI